MQLQTAILACIQTKLQALAARSILALPFHPQAGALAPLWRQGIRDFPPPRLEIGAAIPALHMPDGNGFGCPAHDRTSGSQSRHRRNRLAIRICASSSEVDAQIYNLPPTPLWRTDVIRRTLSLISLPANCVQAEAGLCRSAALHLWGHFSGRYKRLPLLQNPRLLALRSPSQPVDLVDDDGCWMEARAALPGKNDAEIRLNTC